MTYSLFRSFTLLVVSSALLCGAASAQQSANLSVPSADTVVVQAGDTAYSLSRRAGLSLEAFLALNNLSGPTVKVGQVLTLRETAPHVVQAGETLYALSRKYGVTVDALKAANTLPQDATLSVGQTLRVPLAAGSRGNAPTTAQVVQASVTVTPGPAPLPALAQAAPLPLPVALPVAQALPAPDQYAPLTGTWRENALALLGTPYVYGGTSRRGLDCSGFVLQVFTPLGVKLPRVSADQARAGLAVGPDALQPGDLLFFDTAGGGKVTHVGIYLGDDTFVNANSYRGVVTVDHLASDKYWATRFLSARRVMTDTLASQP